MFENTLRLRADLALGQTGALVRPLKIDHL